MFWARRDYGRNLNCCIRRSITAISYEQAGQKLTRFIKSWNKSSFKPRFVSGRAPGARDPRREVLTRVPVNWTEKHWVGCVNTALVRVGSARSFYVKCWARSTAIPALQRPAGPAAAQYGVFLDLCIFRAGYRLGMRKLNVCIHFFIHFLYVKKCMKMKKMHFFPKSAKN